MSADFFCLNNKFYREDHAAFKLNRALKYGDGLFESIRLSDGKPLHLSLHFKRLREGMKQLKMEVSSEQFSEMEICMEQLIIKNEIDSGGRLRLTAFRGGAGKYSPDSNRAVYFMETEKLEHNRYELNSRGLSIEVATENRIYYHPFLRYKTLNALPYIMAAMEKDQKLVDELLLLNQEGRISEATAANVFFVFGNSLYTPEIKEGCLEGVMRTLVLNHAGELGIKVRQTQISPEFIERADEIFLTNAIQGIRWVGSFRKKRYFNRISRKLLASINKPLAG